MPSDAQVMKLRAGLASGEEAEDTTCAIIASNAILLQLNPEAQLGLSMNR